MAQEEQIKKEIQQQNDRLRNLKAGQEDQIAQIKAIRELLECQLAKLS